MWQLFCCLNLFSVAFINDTYYAWLLATGGDFIIKYISANTIKLCMANTDASIGISI